MYMKSCVKESFRLHPITAFNVPHVCMYETMVAGYFIPKGSHVLLSRPDLHLLSFSIGRRGCPAVNLGSTMPVMLLASLLQGFTWSPPPKSSCIELVEAIDEMVLSKPLQGHAWMRGCMHHFILNKCKAIYGQLTIFMLYI
ncbi:phenylalanine N-monooxygenase-like [Impatiens glandulifera]|uniref:phenylalanine N-monooxygenase-like n=1 Tax=Impatiens glandulifera TaxID=253017 RepID=UPI001FB12527|nr:phenylalanine N-monooxygenase-like [Impatiens glandulifera]